MTAKDTSAAVPCERERLLVVEDEPAVRETLSATLRFAGFAVATAATGAEALDAAGRESPDLILLDVMLPDMDGFEVLQRFRDHASEEDGRGTGAPVLFVTAKDAAPDKVNGLRLGGDDYVTKPFDPEELIARIEAVLRRTKVSSASRMYRVADLELDTGAHEVRRAGRTVRLSPTEYRLLHCLLRRRQEVVPKRQILREVWQYDFAGDFSILDTYISYLRRKVDAVEPKLIHTVHGVGYVVRESRP